MSTAEVIDWPQAAPPTRGVDDIGNIEIEQALLGSLLLDNDLYPRIAATLTPEHFVDGVHARLYRIMADKLALGAAVDVRTLKGYLHANETLGQITVREYVARLVQDASGFDVVSYARQIIELSARRELYRIAKDAEAMALEAPPEEPVGALLEKIETAFATLKGSSRIVAHRGRASVINAALEMVNQAHMGKRVGWPWLLPEIAMVMDGPMQPGALYGCLGSSGEGKTSLILQTLRHTIDQGVPFLFLSSEQSAEVCILQMKAQKLGIVLSQMLKPNGISDEEADRMHEEGKLLAKLPWRIENWTDSTVAQLGIKVRSFVKRFGPGVVAIDHAKKIVPDNPRDIFAQQVAQVFSGTHDLMADTGCAGMIVMQRNSDFLKRSNMWPARADVYGGEGPLQNLDGCLTMFRPARWMKQTPAYLNGNSEYREKVDEKAEAVARHVYFGNLKARFGEEGRKPYRAEFVSRFTRFVSYVQERAEREPELIPV